MRITAAGSIWIWNTACRPAGCFSMESGTILTRVPMEREGLCMPDKGHRIILYLVQEHLSAKMRSDSDRSMSASLTRITRQVPRRFDLKLALLLVSSVPDTVFIYIVSIRCPLSGVHNPSLSIGTRVKIVPDSIEKHPAG